MIRIRKKLIVITAFMAMALVMCMPAAICAEPMDGGLDTYRGEMPELQNAIAKQAIECAWPKGTPKAKTRWPGGSRPAAYTAALQKAYGSRSGWSKQCRAGASCDVFVGTVVRSSGYDTKFPRGLDGDRSYLPKSDKFQKVTINSVSDYEPGDLIMYFNPKMSHICVYVEIDGKGYFAEASHSLKAYGRIAQKARVYKKSNFKSLSVYRPCQDCYASYSEGDQSEDVAKIQRFLVWGGFLEDSADGVYGATTTEAVKKYQKEVGLEETGVFDKACLESIPTYSNENAGGTAVAE